MRETWKVFKELWAIKRLRSTIILCLWLVFIGIIVTGLRNTNEGVDYTNSHEYKNYNNYEAVYQIGDIKFTSTTYNNESYIYLNGERYVYMNDELSYNGEVISPIINNLNFTLLQPKNLAKLISRANYDSKVEYTDSVK